jgi:hypothetical protein
MRVKCVRLEGRTSRPFPVRVRIGGEYVVEMITSYPTRGVEFTITDDESDPAQVPADLFETTDGLLPSNWVAVTSEDGQLLLGPQSWVEPDFWLDYWGSEASTRERALQAIDEYRREREVIMRESGRPG